MLTMDNNQKATAPTSVCDRRSFITNAGRGIIAASVLSELSPAASAAQTPAAGLQNATDPVPVKLKPLDAPSEKQAGDPPAPLNHNKRVGFALVGLGHLTI